MKFSEKRHYPICTGCKNEEILYCTKYQQSCISFAENGQAYQICCNDCIKENGYEEKTDNILLLNEEIYPIAKLHIPGLKILPHIKFLLKEKEQYPFAFYKDREIVEIYDAFPGAIWNGRTILAGRPFLGIQEINNIREQVESLNIGFNLTWNNHLIDEIDLNDKFCNLITEIFHNGKHSITVGNDLMLSYLKEKYPHFSYYQSIIQSANNKDFIQNNDYDIQLISTKLNNNWEYLNTINPKERARIEFLCDESCFPTCPKLHHYDLVNYCNKNFAREAKVESVDCPVDWRFSYHNKTRWPITINPEDISKYLDLGFQHFKLEGRGASPVPLFYRVCKYLVKPEYFEDVFFKGVELYEDK